MNSSRQYNRSIQQLSINSTLVTAQARSWDIWETNLLVLLIFGCIGNTLTIMVMRTKRMRSTNAALFLTCMAVADICVLLLKFLVNMQKLYRIPVYNVCILVRIVPETAAFISYWLIITTTAERSVAVWYPLKVTEIFSRRRCFIIIIILVSFFVLLSSTQAFCLQYYAKKPYYCIIKGDENGTCQIYINHVYPWIKSAFMSWLPSIAGIFLNSIIIISLSIATKQRKSLNEDVLSSNFAMTTYKTVNNRRSQSQSPSVAVTPLLKQKAKSNNESPSKMNNSSKRSFFRKLCCWRTKKTNSLLKHDSCNNINSGRSNSRTSLSTNQMAFNCAKAANLVSLNSHCKDRQITIMLCTISVTFVVFTVPYATFELLRRFNESLRVRELQRAFVFFVDCLHATNFILYCLTGKKFRDELVRILKCQRADSERRRSSTFVTHLNNVHNNNLR